MRSVISLELVDVPQHRLPAPGVELGDAVRLDVLLAGEAELLLDGELDRQAVAVPAGLARDVVALHRLEAREDVLEDPRLDVVGARHAVGGRRALVEDPRRAVPRSARGTARRRRSVAPAARAPRARARAGRPARAPGGTSDPPSRRPARRSPAVRFDGGTRRRSARRPAVPPSLARSGSGPLCSRARRGRVYSAGQADGVSSGGSGVIFVPRTPPGSHRPRVAVAAFGTTRPIDACVGPARVLAGHGGSPTRVGTTLGVRPACAGGRAARRRVTTAASAR